MAASSTIRVEQSRFLDPRWRLSNLYTITDKHRQGREIPFVPNTAQLRFLDGVHTLNLILKARPPEGKAIAAARAAFARCQFDEGACELGLRRLWAYRNEWDESRGVWKDRPRHDDASHGADAFLTFPCSTYTPPTSKPTKRNLNWVV